jgi:hypothetical protein
MSAPFMNQQQMLQGLGSILSTPLARGAMRYWWLTVPLGGLGWYYWQQRAKKNEANIGNLVHDIMPAVGVLGTMLTINALLAAQEAKRPAPAAMPAGPIRDAEFTPGPVSAEIASH